MDRVAQEKTTSKGKSSEEAIKAIYTVISSYNGLIKTLIERTEPAKGKWATRKSVDQSTVMYLAEVLKGLIEPLKHLEFQLNQVNDPELASLQGMMNALVDIIDDSPPFKMLDVNIFKNGIPNYEGLADDLDITNSTTYLALLKARREKLKFKLDNMLRVTRGKDKGELSEKIVKHSKDSLAVLDKEIRKTIHLKDAKLADVYVNGALLLDLDDLENAVDEFELPELEFEKSKGLTEQNRLAVRDASSLRGIKEVGKKALLKDLQAKKKVQDKVKKAVEAGYLVTNPGLKDASGNFDGNSLPPGDKKAYLQMLEDITKINNKIESLQGPTPEDRVRDKRYMDATQIALQPEPAAAAATAPPAMVEANTLPLESGVGRGSGRPLADLLANPKQQYNYMQRPISDDQKIQNDMINANRNWQMKNNGPHDTPLGNLNPFLPQDKASRYSYEVLLAADNSQEHPEMNARGADVSLLQGPIANIEGSGKKSKALMQLKKVAIDERNDPYRKGPLGTDGMIPEEKEDQFKLPEFKPKKRK